jgi:hypothetical protein
MYSLGRDYRIWRFIRVQSEQVRKSREFSHFFMLFRLQFRLSNSSLASRHGCIAGAKFSKFVTLTKCPNVQHKCRCGSLKYSYRFDYINSSKIGQKSNQVYQGRRCNRRCHRHKKNWDDKRVRDNGNGQIKIRCRDVNTTSWEDAGEHEHRSIIAAPQHACNVRIVTLLARLTL